MLLDSRADDSAGLHEKENPPTFYAARFANPTRASSPRQLPTDHDHAVPTREYQSDQSSRMLLGCHRPCCPKPTLKAHQREHSTTVAQRQGLAFLLRGEKPALKIKTEPLKLRGT